MTMEAVLIKGDGIGKEIADSVVRISAALGTGIIWKEYQAGAEYHEKTGKLLEDGLIEEINRTGIALKGPTATPSGRGFRSINVLLRQQFSTYANLRPVRSIPGVKSRYEDIDLIVVRENSEDLYKGEEYMKDEDTAHGIKIITRAASERIIRFAFDYARNNGRRKVTCVHKANIMKLTDGLFLSSFNQIAGQYPDIAADSVIIDALCMKLVTDPRQFDVLVAPNLYGDIISDLCAGLIGGLGFAPSVNIGDSVRIYEAVHGSAPDIAGKNLANPSALLMAFEMLMRDQGMNDKADLLDKALLQAIKNKPTQDIGGHHTTTEFVEEILESVSL